MRAKFNYILFVIRILFVLAWSAAVVGSLCYMPGDLGRTHELSGVIGVMAGFICVFSLFTFKLWRAVWTERFSMHINPGQVIIKDHLLFRSFALRTDEIKGFSLSEYPIRISGVQSILLYLINGEKIEFPQFLFFNFKKLAKGLEQDGVPFLGKEPYIWKWIDSRVYKFDKKD